MVVPDPEEMDRSSFHIREESGRFPGRSLDNRFSASFQTALSCATAGRIWEGRNLPPRLP